MAKGQRPVASDKSAIIAEIPRACADETAAVEFFEAQRWALTGPCCPHCGDTNVYQMSDSKTGERNRRFLWRCKGCNKQYTVRVGTVYEDSPIPLRHWCYAFWKACSSKKGVSALQIKRETGLTYKSALFLMHRVRWALAEDYTIQPKLSGIVEADEAFVGGKPRNKGTRKGPQKGWLKDRKTPVVSVVQRNGQMRSFVTTNVTAATVGEILRENVRLDAHLMTDSSPIYRQTLGKPFRAHGMTDHRAGQYALPDGTHSNTVESAFALLKRGIYGTFHNVSRKHLHGYVAEFDFRWNARQIDDGARTARAIRQADGKRLQYRDPAPPVAQ